MSDPYGESDPSLKSYARRNFLLIGAAGYVAPKHIKAIKDAGGNLVAAIDPNDSVGLLDRFFPEAEFFKSIDDFEICRLNLDGIDYTTICSPNHLHLDHIEYGLSIGSDVICEKPTVLRSVDVAKVEKMEARYGKRVNSILQLRLNEKISEIKKSLDKGFHHVNLEYVTLRGKWYMKSWKGDPEKSGGLATNIGIHLFDILIYLFGEASIQNIEYKGDSRVKGTLVMKNARAEWLLSIDKADIHDPGKTSRRILRIDDREFDLNESFNELHSESYRMILDGKGFGLADVAPSIRLVEEIRRK